MKRKKNKALLPIILFLGVIVISIVGLILADNVRKAKLDNPGNYTNQDDIPRITAEEAYQAMLEGEAVLVDARSETVYQSQHIAGAISLPIDQVESRVGELDPDTWYITYCTWPAENTSARAALIMLQNGIKRANPIVGGFEAWLEAGYPVEP